MAEQRAKLPRGALLLSLTPALTCVPVLPKAARYRALEWRAKLSRGVLSRRNLTH
jgi:hypothetical protein